MTDKRDDMYDEFGNYLGSVSDSEEEESFEIQAESDNEVEPEIKNDNYQEGIQDKIELHEEKNYYPKYSEVYPEAETLIQEEDAQDIQEPIIKSPVIQNLIVDSKIADTGYSYDFIKGVLKNQASTRSLAVVGGFHSGKTRFCDIIIKAEENFRVTNRTKALNDYFMVEQKRKLTHLMKPFTSLLEDQKGKSYGLTVIDTPGHPDFFDETKTAIGMVDGVVIVIDVIEGITEQLKEIIKEIKFYEPDVIIVFNKIDRLIIELKIPPEDAYLKLNLLVQELQPYFNYKPYDPNFFFASTRYNILFNISDFSHVYAKSLEMNNSTSLTKVFWGDIYYDIETNEFQTRNKDARLKRSFVEFILSPIYKIFSHCVSKEKDELKNFLQNFNLAIANKLVVELELKKLLQLVFSNIMMNVKTFVSHVIQCVNAPLYHNIRLLSKYNVKNELNEDDLLIIVPKQIPVIPHLDDIPSKFFLFGRILKGTLKKKDVVYMNSESSSEKSYEIQVESVRIIKIAQTTLDTDSAHSGSIILIDSPNNNLIGRGWLALRPDIPVRFRAIALGANVKLGIEPLHPAELIQLHRGINLLQNIFTGLCFKIEETGENIIIGRGELFLDTILLLLRESFAKIEIRVAEPTCMIAETGIVTSHMFTNIYSVNKANNMSFLCEPIEKELLSDFAFVKNADHLTQKNYFKDKMNWDSLALNSIWAFSPEDGHPSYLQDYTIPSETRRDLLLDAKPLIISGYEWAVREGPLCEEPIMNCAFRLSKAEFDEDRVHRSAGQITPCARRGIHSSLLLATPRLMEPYYLVDINCSQESLTTIYTALAKRRGQLISETPNPGTPLYKIIAKLPVLDSFGFETDVRVQTLGQASVLLGFSSWELMPGDPLDKNIKIKTLEPSEPLSLARDVFIKTRRRKGLTEDISILKYFDDENFLQSIKNSFYA